MARRGRESGRVKIQWIQDNKKRNAALKRRLPLVVKKTRELAGLCDVPACLVAYRPDEAEPVVWPSRGAAADVVRQYRALSDSDSRFKNKLDSADYLKQMNDKLKLELSKVQMETREAEIKNVLADFIAGRRRSFDDLPIDFFVSVGLEVEHKLQTIYARLRELRSPPAQLPPPPRASEDVKMVEPFVMMQNNVAITPMMHGHPPPQQHDYSTPMTFDGEPRYGSYLFEVLDACNDPGDGSALPSTEELHAIFVQAGIFSPPLPNPRFYP